MEELNAERIIDIHDDIIREYGGTGGLLTQGTLELLVYKVNREKEDGNKRTAFVTAENVLGEAGYYLDAGDDEIVELMKNIAEYKHTIKTIENWIREKAMATSAPIF